MKNKSFQVSDYGNLLMYDRKYSTAEVKYIIETNGLNGLKIFDFWDPLPSLDFLRRFTFLKELRVTCRDDQDFSFLTDLSHLDLFVVGPSFPMKNEIDLSSLTNVKYLSIQCATNRISGLDACRDLQDLCLVEFPQRDLETIRGLGSLGRLRIKTGSMRTLDGVEHLSSLKEVEIGNCRSLRSIGNLNGLINLKSIGIESCTKIEDYDGLTDLPNLETLRLTNCKGLKSIEFINKFPALKRLHLLGNTDVLDGNLRPAKHVEDALFAPRRHYRQEPKR